MTKLLMTYFCEKTANNTLLDIEECKKQHGFQFVPYPSDFTGGSSFSRSSFSRSGKRRPWSNF